jgi:excisionase family DNA binding protein
MNSSSLPVLLTTAEVADLLKVPRSWIYQRVSNGDLPFNYCKVANFLRFRSEDIAEYIDAQIKAGQQTAAARRRERQT